MGQILNRIKDIVSSEVNSRKSFQYETNQADELEKIINELNTSKTDNNHNEKEDSYQNNNSEVMTQFLALKILELPDDATDEMIKSAYKQKMKEYHPDHVSNLGRDLQKLAELKTKEINLAYEFLKKSKNIE